MEELSLFDFPQLEINKPIRLIELFGGIGSQAFESNINKCCNGKIKSYKGYIWKYA